MNKMEVDLTLKDIVDFLYPIGSLYYTQDSSFNPNNHFGGTWVQIKDKFILACGDTYKINQTGGEASHVLTIDEMSDHSHKLIDSYNCQFVYSSNRQMDSQSSIPNSEWCESVVLGTQGYNIKNEKFDMFRLVTTNIGGNRPHNNMPPFETAFIWKRTGE